MDRLPAEIIELISFDLRREHTPLGPKFEISELFKCLCNTINAQSNAEREESLGDRSFLESKDGAFAFSMTCKRIRAIVFKGRRDRRIASAMCSEALRTTVEMPGKCEGTYDLCIGGPVGIGNPSNRFNSTITCAIPLPRKAGYPLEFRVRQYAYRFGTLHIRGQRSFPFTPHVGPVHGKPALPRSSPVLPGFPFADEWSDILGHLNLPQLSSLKIQLEFGNYDFPDNEECWNVIVKGFKNVNRFPALKDVTLQLKFGVTPESRTDHWKQLCAIGKDILQSRQIDYLDIVVDFFVSPSWTNRRSFFAPLNDGATVLEHMFFPEDNDMKQIVDGLLAIHPSLKIFTLDIYGPTEGIEPGPRGKA